ncbi:hypothetical protein BJ912DRAFT_19831 [Pholiota molesta]|nr:hypothetical protein BJ912DRAFT_19831 [Pholiota molesta]
MNTSSSQPDTSSKNSNTPKKQVSTEMPSSPRLSGQFEFRVKTDASHWKGAPGTPPRSANTHNKNTSSTLTTPVQDKSPASTFSESVSGASFRIAHSRSFPNVTTVPTVASGRRRGLIRSDSSLLTCFDPADKELHDLWAPK